MNTTPDDPVTTAAARYKRAEDAAKKAREALAEAVIEALRQPGAKPSNIAKRASWTPAYIRKLARESGIEADPSYQARTEKARARVIAEATTPDA